MTVAAHDRPARFPLRPWRRHRHIVRSRRFGACGGPTAGLSANFHAYLAIGADGRVTVFSSKIEMGQGVMTSIAQMAAEELGADLASIDMVMGDTDKCPWGCGNLRLAVDPDVRPAFARRGGRKRARC